MQLNLFTSPPQWTPPRVSELPDIRGAKRIGIDTETHDPDLKTLGPGFIQGKSHVLGVSVAVDGWSAYIPLSHYSQNVDNPDQAINWLRHSLGGLTTTYLGANLPYDLDALATLDISIKGHLYDVQMVDSLIDETHMSYSLENIGQRRLQMGKRSLELDATLKDHNLTMSSLGKLEAGYVAKYAIGDAEMLLPIHDSQLEDIKKYDLSKAVNRECRLTQTLWKMHQRGVPIDVDRAVQLNEEWKSTAAKHLDAARKLVGWSFNPDSPKSTGAALRHIGIIPNVTATGKDSVTNDFLENHTADPAVANLLAYRQLNKIRRDFCEGVFLKYEHNGRIYPQWFQSRGSKKGADEATGASTGRITGSKPNLTQIPSRTDIGKKLREAVVAEFGDRYAKLDYSSQEPRIGLHLAFVAKCPGAAEARQRYIEDKHTDYHELTRELVLEKSGVEIIRRDAKTLNLGLTYGMQINTLSEKLGVSKEQAKVLLKAYHKGLPYVEPVTKMAKERAEDVGYIRTVGGRLRHFNKWESTNFGDKGLFDSRSECIAQYGSARLAGTHKAFNSAVQGTAADQMKQAIIDLDDAGMLPLLQVYDETGLSVGSDKQALEAAEIMENALDLTVPSLVEPSIAENWGKA